MGTTAYHYTAADTSEHVVCDKRCRVLGLRPNVTTSGTITLREGRTTGGSAVFSVSAIGLTQVGKSFDGLVVDGFTVQLSNSADLSTIIYEPF